MSALFRNRWEERQSLTGLFVASLLVAVAIVLDGMAARIFNGIGGIVWFVCAAMTVRALRPARTWWMWIAAVGITLMLVVVARPTDPILTVPIFAVGGALMAALATDRAGQWAVLIPAIWLPIHLVVAVFNAVERRLNDEAAAIRAEPPPTAAVVPLLMVLAAWTGGQFWLAFQEGRRLDRQARARMTGGKERQ